MKLFKYIILVLIIWVGLSSLSIRGNHIDPNNIYENAKDVKINKYIDSDHCERFVLKRAGIKDTIGILYQHFYPAHNGMPTIVNPNNWNITLMILGKDRVTYSKVENLEKIKYKDIYISEIKNITSWLKQININELISKKELSYFPEQNIYGLYFFYYLIPEK